MIGGFVLGKSFITGSTVYGTPTKESDLDLVVCVDEETLDLVLNAKQTSQFIEHGEYNDGSLSMRCGKLNMILIESECEFERWRDATGKLRKVKPVSKADAKVFFKRFVDGMDDHAPLPSPQIAPMHTVDTTQANTSV